MCDEFSAALIDNVDVCGGGTLSSVQKSLSRIRDAKARLHVRSPDNATPAALLSQIELCDALLDEIRSISCSLEKRVESPGVPNRRPVANRRHRGTAHLIAPRHVVAGRTKQQK
ncbi:hypothetical protein ACQR16_04895 [Bradyrhizobium oligotrophicum]|uniref:hypothetical protein n=1 Tax=Bradyrhizobium oligotrophicum TaxID=44255 RepID=UPI003EB9CA20